MGGWFCVIACQILEKTDVDPASQSSERLFALRSVFDLDPRQEFAGNVCIDWRAQSLVGFEMNEPLL